jgi:hypothetical protein
VKFNSSAKTMTACRWRISRLGNIAQTPRWLTSHASSREAVHILIDFRTGMIGFLFGGPDSGQQLGSGLDLTGRDEGPALRDGQLLNDLSLSGRSSETARMQD